MRKEAPPGRLARARKFLTHDLWVIEIPRPQYFRRLAIYLFRLAILVWEGFWKDNLFLHAAALTYHLTFAVIPMLAVMLALLKGFGGTEKIVNQLLDQFLHLVNPANQADVSLSLKNFITNINAGSIGVIGAAVLVYTGVRLIDTVEESLNQIWGIKRGRTILRKINVYCTLVLLGPILIGSAFALQASMESSTIMNYVNRIPGAGQACLFALPYLFAWLAFAGFYAFVPNAQVSFRAALAGGVVGGTLWLIAAKLFVLYVSNAKMLGAIYGALGAIPIFLFWLYISWAVVLFGAEVAFAIQNLWTYRRQVESPVYSAAFRELLALHLMAEVARPFLTGAPPPTPRDLEQSLQVPIRVINDVVYQLTESGYLRSLTAPPEGLIPGRDVDRISAKDILDALRNHGSQPQGIPEFPRHARIRDLYRQGDRALAAELGSVTFRSLLQNGEPGDAPPLSDRRVGSEND